MLIQLRKRANDGQPLAQQSTLSPPVSAESLVDPDAQPHQLWDHLKLYILLRNFLQCNIKLQELSLCSINPLKITILRDTDTYKYLLVKPNSSRLVFSLESAHVITLKCDIYKLMSDCKRDNVTLYTQWQFKITLAQGIFILGISVYSKLRTFYFLSNAMKETLRILKCQHNSEEF